MSSVHEILERVGRRTVASRVGVGLTAVSNASVAGKFPASWFPVVRELCEAVGQDCPMDAFNWRTPADADAFACADNHTTPQSVSESKENDTSRTVSP